MLKLLLVVVVFILGFAASHFNVLHQLATAQLAQDLMTVDKVSVGWERVVQVTSNGH